jgi:hypothetical protein
MAGSYTHAVAVTPHDTTLLANVADALYIGGAGNVTVFTVAGTAIAFNGATAGSVIPIKAQRVNATGTTATNIVALRY